MQPTKRASVASSRIPSKDSRTKRSSIIPSAGHLPEGRDFNIRQHNITDIVNFLVNLNIQATVDDLTHPDPVRIRLLFEIMISYFLPWRLEALQENKQRVLRQFVDAPELGQEFAEAYPIFSELKRLLGQIQFTDIKVTDVITPTPSRLLKILSALYNFDLFRESRLAQFNKMSSKADDLVVEQNNLLVSATALQSKIEEAKAQRASEQEEVKEWEARNQEAENMLRQMRKESDVLLADVDACKSERQELKDKLQELQYSILNINEELRQLKIEETWDIDAMKKGISDLMDAIKKREDELKALEEAYPKVDEIYTTIKPFQSKISLCLTIMNKLGILLNDIRTHRKTNDALTEQVAIVEEKRKEVEKNIAALSKIEAAHESRYEKLLEQREKKRLMMDRYFSAASDDKSGHKELEEAQMEEKRCETQIENLRIKNEKERQELQRGMQATLSELSVLFAQINDFYMSVLLKSKDFK